MALIRVNKVSASAALSAAAVNVKDTTSGNANEGSIYLSKDGIANWTTLQISKASGSGTWYGNGAFMRACDSALSGTGSSVTLSSLDTDYSIPAIPDGGFLHISARVSGSGGGQTTIFKAIFA